MNMARAMMAFGALMCVFGCADDTDSNPNPVNTVDDEQRFSGDANACPKGFETPFKTGQYANFLVGEQSRSFYFHLPEDSRLNSNRPVVVMFNGTGGNGREAYPYYNGEAFTQEGFIAIAPDSAANGSIWPVWDSARRENEKDKPNPDLDFVDQLLSCVAAHYAVDKNRIYAVGHSAGGIMTNRVLRSRPDVYAGGIVASGVFDFTAPDPEVPMQPMAVAVTWGGDNDGYSGEADGEDVSVPEFNFAEQAALASAFYDENKGAHMWVRGADLGHTWVGAAGPAMIRFLLAHPKGFESSAWSLEKLPENVSEDAQFTWGVMRVNYVPKLEVNCPQDDTDDTLCHAYCQRIGDCAIENSTVGPVLGPQLMALGFSGDDLTECGGCVSTCLADANKPGDEDVLRCMQSTEKDQVCAGGIDGVMPLVTAVNECCLDRKDDSGICVKLCGSLQANSVVVGTGLFTSCLSYVPIE